MAPQETELKLSCRPEDLDAVLAHPLLRSPSGRKPIARRYVSRYFDTEDDALARAGLTLRVRIVGKTVLQTIKTKGSGAGGLTTRGEWEAPLSGESPDMDLVARWGLAEAVTAATGGRPLVPRFETDVSRATRLVRRPEGEVEIAVDRGMVRAGDNGQDPIAEVELELRGGDPALLHDLALELLADLPLGLGGPSKAARGYRLLGHAVETADPAKAQAVALAPDMPVEDAFRAIGQACLAHLEANAPVVLAGADPEGIHQARVAIRRLRSTMAAFRAMVAGEDGARVVNDLRWLMGILGPARDSDVFAEEILPALGATLSDDPGWPELIAHFERERASHSALAQEAMASPRFTALLLAAARWLDHGAWRRDGDRAVLRSLALGGAAEAVLAKRFKKVLRRGANFEDLPAEARHALRVQIKKLRYTLDFLAPLHDPEAVKATLKTLKTAQEVLGRSNDITVARAKLRSAALTEGAATPHLAFVAGWAAAALEGDRTTNEADARQAWAALVALTPPWETAKDHAQRKDKPHKGKKKKKG
jgi:inorganic triphosphatase YgiF